MQIDHVRVLCFENMLGVILCRRPPETIANLKNYLRAYFSF
jgi:hypothetical protein